MIRVKNLAKYFSKKTQKSALGCNYYQIFMQKNQILCSIVWNYVHKSMLWSTSDTARPYSTIFNETIIVLSLTVAYYFNVLCQISLVASMSEKSYCSHHMSVTTFLRLTDNNWAEIWKMSWLELFFFEGLLNYSYFIVRLRAKVRDLPIEFQLIVNGHS